MASLGELYVVVCVVKVFAYLKVLYSSFWYTTSLHRILPSTRRRVPYPTHLTSPRLKTNAHAHIPYHTSRAIRGEPVLVLYHTHPPFLSSSSL